MDGDWNLAKTTGGPRSQGGWKATLAAILKAHNTAKVNGSVASHATRDKRADVLYAGFKRLRELGFKLGTVRSFKGKHMAALAQDWEARGLSASTLQVNISIFRVFAHWIGKEGMVERAEKYVSPGAATRTSIAQKDRSWNAQNVDIAAKLAEVSVKDARVGLQMALQATFGLRARESMQLRPHVADKGLFLAVTVGTKGGRDRVVPIDTPQKRALLEKAKSFAASKLASTSDPNKTLAQVKNHYYAVLRSCGITRANGITGHGLRHGYANDRYEQIAGHPSPVRGGTASNPDDDHAARLEVAEELGHSRESVTTHYLGR